MQLPGQSTKKLDARRWIPRIGTALATQPASLWEWTVPASGRNRVAINQQTLERFWNEIRAKVQQRWGELSKEDLQRARQSVEQLVAVIQQRTGNSREQIRRYLDDLSVNVRSAFESSSQQARSTAQKAQQVGEQSIRQASDSLRAGYIQTGRSVRRHPWEAVAISFGVFR